MAQSKHPASKVPAVKTILIKQFQLIKRSWKALFLFVVLTSLAALAAAYAQFDISFVVVIIGGLVCIDLFRQAAHNKDDGISLSAAVYDGTNQVVSFTVVLLMVVMSMLPALLAIVVYQVAIEGYIAIAVWEKLVVGIGTLAFGLPSLFLAMMLTFAMIIASLQGMRPVTAIGKARNLLKGRNWLIGIRVSWWVALCGGLSFGVLLAVSISQWLPAVLAANAISLSVVLPLYWSYWYALYLELLT